MVRAISLFTGAGGLDLGFERAGFDVILANDSWKDAGRTYVLNRPSNTHKPPVFVEGDVRKNTDTILGAARRYRIDLLMGGPPCQDFSSAGLRTGRGKRADMTTVFADIAAKAMPRWVVMENVNTIVSIGKRNYSRNVAMLKRAGYGITTVILNAADYGIPQSRKRFFMICRRNGSDDDPEIIRLIGKSRRAPVSVRQYYPGITRGPTATRYYYRHPWSFQRRGIYSIDEQSPTIRGVNRPIPPSYRIHRDDATSDLRRVRPLTAAERAIIQTFPRRYSFYGKKTQVEQQIGNSVPPLLARAVARAVAHY